MAEVIIVALAVSAVKKIASFTGDYVVTEFNGIRSVKEDLKAISVDLESIMSVLADAEAKQYTNAAMKIWLRDLKSVVYDIDDLLDEVSTDAKRRTVSKGHLYPKLGYYLSLTPLKLQFHLSHEIKCLRLKLARVVVKKNTFGLTDRPVGAPSVQRDVFDACDYVNTLTILGRDDAKKHIINRVLDLAKMWKLSVLPILGMGGIGKTALAKLVYEDISSFDIKLWVCVSDKFEIKVILEDLLEDATQENTSNYSLGKLVEKLQGVLRGKSYFLVLDDLWEDNVKEWREFKSILDVGGRGSVILITTRIERVAYITQTTEPYALGKLSNSVCWHIFINLAFAEGEEKRYPRLCEIGMSIVEKCCGIPLVVQSLGSLLRSERNKEEWLRINNMENFSQLDGQYNSVKKHLKLNYDNLPSHLKLVFTHLSLYTKGSFYYPAQQIPYYFSALGLLQLPGKNYSTDNLFIELLSRSMLQDVEWTYNNSMQKFKIHDLFHDLAGDLLGEDLAVVNESNFSVPDSSRYIAWRLSASPYNEFPEKLKAKNARSFMFQFLRSRVISPSFIKGIISYMPRLRILSLWGCQFEKLPSKIGNLKHLRVLDMTRNALIKSLPNTVCDLLNLEYLALCMCKQLSVLPSEMYKLISLRFLVLTTSQKRLAGTEFNKLPSLRHLWFTSCMGLVSLWDSDDVGCLGSLRNLGIFDCPTLTSLPNSMKLLVDLEELTISNCEMLDLETGDALSGLQNLRALRIEGVPFMSHLPNDITSSANSLNYLSISNCGGLLELSTCFESFASLERLIIKSCPRLLSLPEGICDLKSLRHLFIEDCTYLSRRCAPPNGENVYLIQHIPEIILDGNLMAYSKPTIKQRYLPTTWSLNSLLLFSFTILGAFAFLYLCFPQIFL